MRAPPRVGPLAGPPGDVAVPSQVLQVEDVPPAGQVPLDRAAAAAAPAVPGGLRQR